jgi:hypothetical protein
MLNSFQPSLLYMHSIMTASEKANIFGKLKKCTKNMVSIALDYEFRSALTLNLKVQL